MARFPLGTGYAGPNHCYDDMIDPEQLLRRLAYGYAAPLLGWRKRMDDVFFGRLLDALANSHAVLVKASPAEQTCRNVAARLRVELPADLFSVGVLYAPEREEWLVMAYNRVPKDLRRPPVRDAGGTRWIGTREVARVLNVHPTHAARVMASGVVRARRDGGRNEIQIRQQDLVVLANRPKRWRRRARSAA